MLCVRRCCQAKESACGKTRALESLGVARAALSEASRDALAGRCWAWSDGGGGLRYVLVSCSGRNGGRGTAVHCDERCGVEKGAPGIWALWIGRDWALQPCNFMPPGHPRHAISPSTTGLASQARGPRAISPITVRNLLEGHYSCRRCRLSQRWPPPQRKTRRRLGPADKGPSSA